MKIKLKFPRKIKGSLYTQGVYEMPESVKKDWYFEALLKSGDLSIVEEKAPFSGTFKEHHDVKHHDPEPSRAAMVESIEPSEKPSLQMESRSTLDLENQPEREDIPAKKPSKKSKGK